MTSLKLIRLDYCPICGNGDNKIISDKVRTINPKSNIEISLRECGKCSHWWNTPSPRQSDLMQLYEMSSLFVVSDDWHPESVSNRPISYFENMVIMSDLNFSTMNYLEVGCGDGVLFKTLENRFLKAYGIEPGKCFVSENIKKDLSHLPDSVYFDVLVFQNVIEHVVDPLRTLTTYTSRTNGAAHLFAAFPNKDSMIAQIKKQEWDMVRPFGHLHYFSQQSLRLLLEKADWLLVHLEKGPNRFPLRKLKTYNIYRTLKRVVANDQWYIRAKRA